MSTWAPLCDRIVFVVDNSTKPPPRRVTTSPPDISNASELDWMSPLQRYERAMKLKQSKLNYEWEEAPESYRGYEFLKLHMETAQSERYKNIWEKSWKTWHHVGTHHLEDAEWFLKIDDDTFFSPINFKGFARYFNPNKKWYLGNTLMHLWKDRNIVFNAGSCYALSRGALKKLVTVFESDSFLHRGVGGIQWWLCMNRAGPFEDPSMGVCLHSIGIDPTNTLDANYRERFSPFREVYHHHLNRGIKDVWYWKWKPSEIPWGSNESMTVHPVSFHGYKHAQADELRELHEKYNVKEGVNGKRFEIPPPPKPFWHQKIDFEVDEWRNSVNGMIKDQLVYLGPGKERMCIKC